MVIRLSIKEVFYIEYKFLTLFFGVLGSCNELAAVVSLSELLDLSMLSLAAAADDEDSCSS